MKILVLGGDKRMDYAAAELERLGFETERSADGSLPDGEFNIVLLPLPLTKNDTDIFASRAEASLPFEIVKCYASEKAVILGGGSSPVLSELCEKNGYVLENYFSSEPLTLKNAALTAEAACSLMIENSDGSLLGSKALITGYGRISRYLAERLKAFGCDVTIAARRAEQRTEAVLDGFSAVTVEEALQGVSGYDFIANTVPAELFSEKEFREMGESVFLELASLPNRAALAASCGARYVFAGGLPGKFSPKTAGIFIAEEVSEILKNHTPR